LTRSESEDRPTDRKPDDQPEKIYLHGGGGRDCLGQRVAEVKHKSATQVEAKAFLRDSSKQTWKQVSRKAEEKEKKRSRERRRAKGLNK
jgi:hypothetical protein